MIDQKYCYAVVGASKDPNKYGHKVFKDLLEADFQVYAVNPRGGGLLGQPVYPDLAQIPDKIDVVVFVTPPPITLSVLKQLKQLEINQVWFQPGSASEEILHYCQQHQIEYTHNQCIMVQRRLLLK
ncbi:MAG: hypothetical protein XD95_0700 [Microgenomates bacterium 39_7]|nr:MAG: hypothetical protein XD95_0700 [Microgenomates bacterium 39_7]